MQTKAEVDRGAVVAPQLLSVREAAASLRVSVRLIWRLLAVGELDRVNVGRCVRIPSESIKAFCAKGGAR